MMDKRLLAAMVSGITANPVLSHMRKVAYSPVRLSTADIIKSNGEAVAKAEAKRQRKQARNLQTAKVSCYEPI